MNRKRCGDGAELSYVVNKSKQAVDYCMPLPSRVLSSIFYSAMTVNFDNSIPKSDTFISVPKCIIAVCLVKSVKYFSRLY